MKLIKRWPLFLWKFG